MRPALLPLALLTTLLLAPAAPAAHGATCPGRTLYRAHGIRVTTRVAYHQPHHHAGYDVFYACRGGRRWVFLRGDTAADTAIHSIGLYGTRLGFIVEEDAEVFIGYAGWTDVRTHATRLGKISEFEDPGEPTVPVDRIEYRIARDGAMALLGDDGPPDHAQKVALLEPSRTRGEFKPCRTLIEAPHGGLVFGTLRITPLEVSVERRDGTRVTFDR